MPCVNDLSHDPLKTTGGTGYTGMHMSKFWYHHSRSTMYDDPGLEQRLSRFEAQWIVQLASISGRTKITRRLF